MIEWRADESHETFREQIGTVDPTGRGVPVALWTPHDPPPHPLVLIGHGSAGHKQDDSRRDLAGRYARAGVAAAAIDGPWHGERGDVPGPHEFNTRAVDAMVRDWRATLDALSALPEIDGGRVGYGGVSMGTMFGLPFVAADPRVRAATLGLCGLRRADGSRMEIADRLAEDARALTARPVLFLVQWDDDLFERAGALELFDLIGSTDKRLLANTGLHHETPLHAREASTAFLTDALREHDTDQR